MDADLLQGLGLIALGIAGLALGFRISYLEGKVRQHYIEHKDDALNLEEQIKSIEPNRWVEGKRPVPIRPVPGKLW